MKPNTITFLFFIICFITLSCSEEAPLEEEETPIDTPQLSLIYPLQDDDDVHYCCFSMQWEDSENEGVYNVQISENSSFNVLLLDTIVTETSFQFPSVLFPSEKYYWKVIPDNIEEIQMGKFRIIDYVDRLSRSYDALIHSYTWGLYEGSLDTTHQTVLEISKGDNNYSFSYDSDHTNLLPNVPFVAERNEGFILFEIDHSYPPDNDYLKYYFDNDSIFIYSSSGGNGGGGNSTIKAVYE